MKLKTAKEGNNNEDQKMIFWCIIIQKTFR